MMHLARPEVVLQLLCYRIQDFEDLLQKQDRVLGVVEAEAREVAQRFGRDRRTMLTADTGVWAMANASELHYVLVALKSVCWPVHCTNERVHLRPGSR